MKPKKEAGVETGGSKPPDLIWAPSTSSVPIQESGEYSSTGMVFWQTSGERRSPTRYALAKPSLRSAFAGVMRRARWT
jgi:hypothetical protein